MSQVRLLVGTREVKPVNDVVVTDLDHLNATDGIRFQLPDGVALPDPGDTVNMTVGVGSPPTIYSFGPYVVDTVRTRDPEFTTVQARDDTVDARILNGLVKAAIPANPPRASYIQIGVADGTYEQLVAEAIRKQTSLASFTREARNQLLRVVKTRAIAAGVVSTYALGLITDEATAVDHVIPDSDTEDVIQINRTWTEQQGEFTAENVAAALMRLRVKYQGPRDDRTRTTPANDNARNITGTYTSLTLAGDGLARAIVTGYVNANTTTLNLRDLRFDIQQGQVVSFDGVNYRVIQVTHNVGVDKTTLQLQQAGLVTAADLQVVYDAVLKHLQPPRPQGLAQGVEEGGTTQLLWNSALADNIDGYRIERYINTDVDSTTYTRRYNTSDQTVLDRTNLEIHELPGKSAHVFVNVNAGRRYPTILRSYNELGISSPGVPLTGELTVPWNTLPGYTTSVQNTPDDPIIVLTTRNIFPVIPSRSITAGFTEFVNARGEDSLENLEEAGRLFDKIDSDFPFPPARNDLGESIGVDELDRAANIIITADTGFTVDVATDDGTRISTPLRGIGLINAARLGGVAAPISCSTLCVGLSKSLAAGHVANTVNIPSAVLARSSNPELLQAAARAFAIDAAGINPSFVNENVAGKLLFNFGKRAATLGRVLNFFGGPVGWAITALTFPAQDFLGAALDNRGLLVMFDSEPNGWTPERVEFQWRWSNVSGTTRTLVTSGNNNLANKFTLNNFSAGEMPSARLRDQALVDAGIVAADADRRLGWYEYDFVAGQQNSLGNTTGRNSQAEIDWLNKSQNPSRAQLEYQEQLEAGVTLDIEDDADVEYLTRLFRMRQTTNIFNHKTAIPLRFLASVPDDVQYRFRVVVDSQPDVGKQADKDNFIHRVAYSRAEAEALRYLNPDRQSVQTQHYNTCRYRASAWHTTDWLPFKRQSTVA